MRRLSLNERRLIELIATRGVMARTDLARETGLTGASVTRIIGELLDLEVLVEEPDKRGGIGQPRRMLSLRPGRYFSAGITFSKKSLELALVDFSGAIVGERRVEVNEATIAAIAEAAASALQLLCRRHGVQPDRVIGIGCAMPGNFGDDGESLRAHGIFAELDHPETLSRFGEALGQPVEIENDGTAAALGEQVYGRLEGDGPSMFLLHLGHGIGGGAVVDGTPFRGVHGNACLPGFLFPYGAPRPSGLDLLETLADAGVEVDDFGDLECLPPQGQAVLEKWIGRASGQLRLAIRAASAFFDPSVIVVGGRLPASLNRRLVERATAEPVAAVSRGLPIAPVRASVLGPSGSAIGAACLPLSRIFFAGANAGSGNPYLDGRRDRRTQ